MAGEWSGSAGALSHGYLVVAISAYLFVRAVPQAATLEFKPMWWLLPIVFALSLAWLLAYVATVVAVQTIVLPAILFLSIVAVYGLQVGRLLAFPVLYVYFAIPAWEHMQFVFQAITVYVVGVLIRIADIPALLDGNFVHLADGTFEIAGGCSGLAFVLAGLSLAVLYSHMFYENRRQALVLVAATLVVAMASNWVRVFVIISIGHFSQMQSPLVGDHLTFGWLLFAVLLVPLYWFARRLEGGELSARIAAEKPSTVEQRRVSAPAFVAALAVMLCGPVWAATVAAPAKGELDLSMPAGSDGWIGPAHSNWDWEPIYVGADEALLSQYAAGDKVVLVYRNLYRVQRQGKELVYFASRIEGDWRTSRTQTIDPIVKVSDQLSFRQQVASNYAGDWLIWYRYQVGRRIEVRDVDAKLAQALETLQGRPQAGVIAFATQCVEGCDHAAQSLERFVTNMGGAIFVNDSRREN